MPDSAASISSAHQSATVVVSASAETARRDRGAFYTPSVLADYVAREALQGLGAGSACRLRIIDPSCGDGALLSQAARRLLRRANLASVEERVAALREHLYGVDRHEQAPRSAAISVAKVAVGRDANALDWAVERLQGNFRCGDALLDELTDLFPSDFRDSDAASGSFDAVLANPPFVNIRRLGKIYSDDEKQRLRKQYASASGNFDLYVLFIERALQWMRPGGRAVFITPNKFATLRYAEACREMLLRESTLESVLDATSVRFFEGAGVYPYVWAFRKREAGARDAHPRPVQIRRIETALECENPSVSETVDQCRLSAKGFVLRGDWDLESRAVTAPLGELADLDSGASGYTAKKLIPHLVDAASLNEAEHQRVESESWPFIVSGNIDRYRIDPVGVRYMQHEFQQPRLGKACPLTQAKRQLYGSRKIVVAGMSRRLEAAWDVSGFALGVQVYAVRPRRRVGGDDDTWRSMYLLGLLNSKLFTQLFRIRFAAKRLAGGYLAINKGQLEQLPIVLPETEKQLAWADCIVEIARRIHEGGFANPPLAAHRSPARTVKDADGRLDRLVYSLYQLRPSEVEETEKFVADDE